MSMYYSQDADRHLRVYKISDVLVPTTVAGIYGYWSDTTAMDNLRGADITSSTVVSVCAP